MKLAVQRLVIDAPAEQVFEHFVDPALFGLWMAEGATLDPVAGGSVELDTSERRHRVWAVRGSSPATTVGLHIRLGTH